LIGACAELAETLLRACPSLRILVTSREALNIPGEVTWRVPSMASHEAMQLFIDRARAARPGFAVTDQNALAIARICALLDGIPLAIELAAARLRVLSVEQIAERLNERFTLLTGGSRTALPRQQTLRATIDWSYDLLTEEERSLFRRLSVFAGGWTLEAAEAICVDTATVAPPLPRSAAPPSLRGKGVGGLGVSNTLDLLTQLVDKSLVMMDEGASGARYSMLETIRQYAHEKLVDAGEYEQARLRHLEYFIGLAQTCKPHLHGTEQVAWLDKLEAELDNQRAALEWAAQTRDLRRGERLVDGLWDMWYERGYCLEGRKWIKAVLPVDLTGSSGARVTACLASGWLAQRIGMFSLAYADFARILSDDRQFADIRQIVHTIQGLGVVHPDEEQGFQLLQEAARLARENGLRSDELIALAVMSRDLLRHGDSQQAMCLLTEALTGYRELGDISSIALMLEWLGELFFVCGDYVRAAQALEECVTLAHKLKSAIQVADALIQLATVDLYRGDDALAMAAVRESVAAYRSVGNLERVGQCLSVAAGVAHIRSQPQRAAALLGAADHLWHSLDSKPITEITAEFNKRLPAVRAELNPIDFERAWAEGYTMSLDQATEYALANMM
jgi:non-specific serine/threonine protein kinase